MIDPHVHLRDGRQAHKETVKRGLEVAWRAGLDAVFEMPNTDPPLLSERTIRDRIELADRSGVPIFHGLFAGLTSRPSQIEEMVRVHKALFPRVVGLKMFAGSSTGDLAIPDEADQSIVFKVLSRAGYRGVLAIHCEKESLMRAEMWDPASPVTHCLARSPEAELESVRDMLRIARKASFQGTLHVCHISLPESVRLLREEKAATGLRLTCGVTPHHLLLSLDVMKGKQGLLLKVNPPLRGEDTRFDLLQLLLEGKIDWIETDHAPHTMKEKMGSAGSYPSGFPGLPIYPHLLLWLRRKGLSDEALDAVTHSNITRIFGIRLKNRVRQGNLKLAGKYDFDPYKQSMKGLGDIR